jgi:hypothetical protein
MKRIALALVFTLAAIAMSGCQLAPALPTIITIGSDAGTIAALNGIKDPAQRQEAAQKLYAVSSAVYNATGATPDFTALNKVITTELAGWNSPYEPMVQALVQQVVTNAETQAAAAPQSQQTAIAISLLHNGALGVEMAAIGYLPPPATAPATKP